MAAEKKDKQPNGKKDRRKDPKPRRRLVDLTLKPGTDRRGNKGRRKTDLVPSTERPCDGKKEE